MRSTTMISGLSAFLLVAVPVAAQGQGGNCQYYPPGNAPMPPVDTPEAFDSYSVYSDLANNATAPDGYTESFANLSAAVVNPSYIGVWQPTAYDPEQCATLCEQFTECTAFNLYIIRLPSQNAGPGCENTTGRAVFRCALYGDYISADQADNTGQDRGTIFEVKIRASNGYNVDRPQCADCTPVTVTSTPDPATTTVTGSQDPATTTVTNSAVTTVTNTQYVHDVIYQKTVTVSGSPSSTGSASSSSSTIASSSSTTVSSSSSATDSPSSSSSDASSSTDASTTDSSSSSASSTDSASSTSSTLTA